MKENTIICSFWKRCKNHGIECNHCKWNANIDISDYLLLQTEDGKIIRYL